MDPVPVQIVDDDILFHNALVVAAPGNEGHIVPAPGAKALHRLGKGEAVGQPLLIKTGDLLHFIMHTPEVYGLYVHRKFLTRLHIFRELDRADLNNLAAQMDGQLVKNGGFGTHRLVPFQIHHNIVHSTCPFA